MFCSCFLKVDVFCFLTLISRIIGNLHNARLLLFSSSLWDRVSELEKSARTRKRHNQNFSAGVTEVLKLTFKTKRCELRATTIGYVYIVIDCPFSITFFLHRRVMQILVVVTCWIRKIIFFHYLNRIILTL